MVNGDILGARMFLCTRRDDVEYGVVDSSVTGPSWD